MSQADIAVIIPFFQRRHGLLEAALRSALSQAEAARLRIVVIDDGSPVSARAELARMADVCTASVEIVERANAGAGAARNSGLDSLPGGIRYVAFLDSDDAWRPGHLTSALRTLELGADVHFADWWSFNFPEQSNFERIGPPHRDRALALDASLRRFDLGTTPMEHVVGQGGGVIQTSTVVYRFDRFRDLRFREQFYNCQDLVFWIDLGERGARFAFCLDAECDNGEGINIYQRSGWGTERSLQRLRNELLVWTSVERFYRLPPHLVTRNRQTIRNLEEAAVRDLLHRARRGLPIPYRHVKEIVRLSPGILLRAPRMPFKIARERMTGAPGPANEGP
jgi:succinoglycan biosynthesis protein ExoW